MLHSILYSILRVQFLLGNLMICCHNVVVVHNTSFFGFNAPKLKIYVGGTENNICHAFFSTSKDNCNCTMLWAISGQLQKVPVWKDSKVAAVFHSGRAISSPCVLLSKNPNQSWAYPDDPTTQVLKIPMTCQPKSWRSRWPVNPCYSGGSPYEPGQLLGTTQCARWPSRGTSTNLKEHPTAKSNTLSKGSFISGEVPQSRRGSYYGRQQAQCAGWACWGLGLIFTSF